MIYINIISLNCFLYAILVIVINVKLNIHLKNTFFKVNINNYICYKIILSIKLNIN